MMPTIKFDKKIQKRRTIEELRESLTRFIHRKHTMCIPPQVSDDDITLGDGIRELKELRQLVRDMMDWITTPFDSPYPGDELVHRAKQLLGEEEPTI